MRASGGEFYVTTGLLQKANDEQLRGILAHEVAHDDLGHVAKAQVLGTGLNLRVILLEQIIPGSSVITPIARAQWWLALTADQKSWKRSACSRDLATSRLLYGVMIDALAWVSQSSSAVADSCQLILQPKTESQK